MYTIETTYNKYTEMSNGNDRPFRIGRFPEKSIKELPQLCVYRPTKAGFFLSKKACTPILWSSLWKQMA